MNYIPGKNNGKMYKKKLLKTINGCFLSFILFFSGRILNNLNIRIYIYRTYSKSGKIYTFKQEIFFCLLEQLEKYRNLNILCYARSSKVLLLYAV